MPTWVGGAPAVKQITTLTVAGTPGSTETLTVTCNSKSMVVTLPAGQTTSQVATEIAASLMANSQTDPAPATGYTRSVGGREIPEFRDFTAEASGSTVILSSLVAGTPFTVTLAESMAAGTFTQVATQAATGPNHADNVANYRDGALPGGAEIMDAEGAVDILYGLTFLHTGTIAAHIQIDLSKFTGQIGLPPTNAGGGYDEYRDRHLKAYSPNASERRLLLHASGQTNLSSKPIYIQLGTNMATVEISAGRGNPTIPNIEIYVGMVEGTTVISAGSVLVNQTEFDAALYCGKDSGSNADCRVIGRSVNVEDAQIITVYSGFVSFDEDIEYTAGAGGLLNIYGGSVEISDESFPDAAIAVRNVKVYGGTFVPRITAAISTTTNTIEVFSSGTVDFRSGTIPQDWAAVKLHSGAAIHDPRGLSGDGTNNIYDTVGCTFDQLSARNLPGNLRYTTSAIP